MTSSSGRTSPAARRSTSSPGCAAGGTGRDRDDLCDRFDLDPTKKARTYSKGNRQKVALISALASDVDLLLLDEPTAGLDPLMEAVFQQSIREVKAAGRTVLLSSHILAQVEALADRISIVRQGRIVETGSLSDLRHMTRTTFVAETDRAPEGLDRIDGVHDLSIEGTNVSFQVDGDRVDEVVRALAPLGVRSLVAHPPTLEQLLMRHYGDALGRRHRVDPRAGDGPMTAPTMSRTRRGPDPGGSSTLAGTGTMLRLILRRDRIRLPVWIGAHGLLVLYIGAALPQLAPREENLAEMTAMLSQPVGRMFTGPAFGMDAPTYERFFAAGYVPYLFVLAALMNIFLVTRHTRGEEESGRAELIRANVTGRHTALTATLLVAGLANAATTVLVTAVALAMGYPATGSALVGLAAGLTGLAFTGITAITVQLSEFSRPAAGMAGGVLGAAFLLRALGDMAAIGGSALSWASPLGWAAQTAPYVHDRWAPLLLSGRSGGSHHHRCLRPAAPARFRSEPHGHPPRRRPGTRVARPPRGPRRSAAARRSPRLGFRHRCCSASSTARSPSR